nr:retrovirus-related Pol polyprotein from transposon TNT 1-94 [Tanacetum cinerariifolium]
SKGKEIAKPITPPSESASEEDSDPEQAQRDKDMQKNLALIAKYFKRIYKPTNNNLRTSSDSRNKNVDTSPWYKNENQSGQIGNQRTMNVIGARENVGSSVVQQSEIQCFNCKEFGRFAKECRKPKRVKDSAYHKEKMLLCKQAEKYEVPTADSGTDSEPLEQVQNDIRYNVFANELQHFEQSESISNTCLVETDDSIVIPDSPYMCDDDIHNDQNDLESDDERVALANLKLDVDENKKIQNQLKKANTTLAQELKECKTILAKTSKTLGKSNSVRDSCLVALQNKQTEFEKYKVFSDRTIDYEKLKCKLNETLRLLAQKDIETKEGLKPNAYEISVVKEKHDELIKQSLLTKSHYEGLVKQKTKTQNDSFIFVHELKQEMHADLKYVESLEKEIDELESDKAEFSNMYDMILPECKPTPFSDSLERKYFSKTKSVPKTNVSEGLSKTVTAQALPQTARQVIVQLILFIVDSGCTKHMTGNLKLLCNFDEKYMGTVHFGNDQFAPILGFRDLVQGNITINRVYYVEGLNRNLFSVGQFCYANLEVAFQKSTCFIRDLQGNDLLTGNRGSDLYTISFQESTSLTPLCLMVKASPTQAWLWHRRLSHLNFDYINLLSKKDVMIGLPKLKYVKDQLCSSCELSKAKKSSFKSKVVPSLKRMLNLLHMDLCGPMRVASINRKKYILVIVEDYSRYT